MDKFSEAVIGDIKDEVSFLTDDLYKILEKIQAQPSILEKVDAFVEEIYILIMTKVSEKLTQVNLKKENNFPLKPSNRKKSQIMKLMNVLRDFTKICWNY